MKKALEKQRNAKGRGDEKWGATFITFTKGRSNAAEILVDMGGGGGGGGRRNTKRTEK